MKTSSALALVAALVAALVGVAAAFVRPAYPYQQTPESARQTFATASYLGLSPENTARVGAAAPDAAFVDAGLDNPLIEDDAAIHPARKCAVCIG